MSLYDAAPYILAVIIVLFCAGLGDKKRRQGRRPAPRRPQQKRQTLPRPRRRRL